MTKLFNIFFYNGYPLFKCIIPNIHPYFIFITEYNFIKDLFNSLIKIIIISKLNYYYYLYAVDLGVEVCGPSFYIKYSKNHA